MSAAGLRGRHLAPVCSSLPLARLGFNETFAGLTGILGLEGGPARPPCSSHDALGDDQCHSSRFGQAMVLTHRRVHHRIGRSVRIMALRIGSVELGSHLILAPMSGVTDRIFRRLIRHCNGADVGLYVTEFISVECLWRENKRSLFMMRKDVDESPFCVQLYGREVHHMVAAGQLAVDQRRSDRRHQLWLSCAKSRAPRWRRCADERT